MITVIERDNEYLNLKAHYEYKDQIKAITGAQFDFGNKIWFIPKSSLDELMESFESRLYFKTPLWKIKGLPEPPKVKKHLYDGEPILPNLNLKLYDYQEEGVKFLIDRIKKYGFALNADGVGLGKTAQAIATMKWFLENIGYKKFLVICKKSIKYQWAREIEKFLNIDDFHVFITGKNKKERVAAYNGFKETDCGLLVTNYHNYLNDCDYIKEAEFDFVIIDEVHSLKTHTGKMNNNITDIIQGKPILFLTGTPIMAQPSDIFGIVQMADGDYFGNYKEFEKEYLDISYGIYGKLIIGAKNLDKLNGMIQEFMIRRTENDVSVDLPDVVIEKVLCEKDSVQDSIDFQLQEILDVITRKKEKMLEDGVSPIDPEFQDVVDKEKQYIAAKQFIADDPRVFEQLKHTAFNKLAVTSVPKSYTMSSKTETTIEMVEDIVASERKVIIFTHFRSTATMLAEDIKKKTKLNVLMYTGAEDEHVRERNIDLFINDDNYNILIGNEACAEGLNLQCANYIINYEQADTYAQKEQRIGRSRRVGSKYKVSHVFDMITENSYDQTKLNKISRGKDLSESLMTS